MFLPKQRRSLWIGSIIAVFVLIVSFVITLYFFVIASNPAALLSVPLVQQQLVRHVGKDQKNLISAAPTLLGLAAPRTYLLLFLNNTELRPGGGFIGSYAVVKFNEGRPTIVKVEGTEIIDRESDKAALPPPPSVLSNHLKVDRWYFRDSNWSPDFQESSRQSLALYQAEHGVAASAIDAVVGVTTHVLEELLEKTGPITVRGIEFTRDTVIEKLEYEVEYGYEKKGLAFSERKEILGELFHEIMVRLGSQVLTHAPDYAELIERLAQEKHLMAYAVNPDLSPTFSELGWLGSMTTATSTDYLLWVDANLAALKTDHAMRRVLSYEMKPDHAGSFMATTTMTYYHEGRFDWRTSRYRTYARVYVPKGSELISVQGSMKWDRSKESGTIDRGEELEREWFGTFISLEPGTSKSLSFTYRLPLTVTRAIDQKQYSLTIPKQLGTGANRLTLDLNFDTTIRTAQPAEDEKSWGDSRYQYSTDLRSDRFFYVGF